MSLSVPELGKLAREMAMDIRDKTAILSDFRLSDADYELLLNNESYKKLLLALTQEWNSSLSTHDRIKFQAAAGLEDGLQMLASRLSNKDEPLSGAVETGKLLAKLAGVGEGVIGARTGEKFTINISLGNQKLSFENEIRPVQSLAEGASEVLQIPAVADKDGISEAVQQITAGVGTGFSSQSQPETEITTATVGSEEEST